MPRNRMRTANRTWARATTEAGGYFRGLVHSSANCCDGKPPLPDPRWGMESPCSLPDAGSRFQPRRHFRNGESFLGEKGISRTGKDYVAKPGERSTLPSWLSSACLPLVASRTGHTTNANETLWRQVVAHGQERPFLGYGPCECKAEESE